MPLDEQGVPTPDVMRGVIPYLALAGRAGEAADFYARAFGALDLGRVPMSDDSAQLMHVQVEINSGSLMMTDHQMAGGSENLAPEGGSPRPGLGGHLQLVVDDGRAWWDRAITAGCREVSPYTEQFWGDRWGLLVDPFGIRWAILEPGPAPST